MAMEVMEVERRESLHIPAVDYNHEHGKHEFWEELKQILDDELTAEEFKRVLYLVKDKIGVEMIGGREPQHPTDLLNMLENNMLMEDALSIIEHVFSVMDTYPEYGEKSFRQIVRDHMNVRKQFGCPNIIGREEEISCMYRWLEASETKGIWLHGAGGLGKTLVAKEVCMRLFSQNRSIVVIDLKHVTSSVEFVRSILSGFAVYFPLFDLKNLTAELLYQLKSISQDTCVLLDNIEDVYQSNEEEVQDVLHRLWDSPAYMPIKWIVTSRLPLKTEKDMKIESLKLGPLRRESAEKLLKQSCRSIELSETRCEMLLDMAGDVPLAIRLLSAELTTHKYKNITDNQLRVLMKQQMKQAIQNCIQFSYRSLTEQEKYQLHMLSVLETSQFDIEIVKAVLEAEEQDAIFLMLKLTNRQIIQRMPNSHIKEKTHMPLSGLEYCIHPLIFEYIRELPMPREYTFQAQSNFCKHMILKIEPCIANYDGNYMEAIEQVSSNRPLLKIMFNVLSLQQTDIKKFLTSNRDLYLSKLQIMLQMTQSEKDQLYRNIIERLELTDRRLSLVFWKLEKVRMMIDCKRFSDAYTEISSIEEQHFKEIGAVGFDPYLIGMFWYNKGRLLRCKEEKQPNKAIQCFNKSLTILQNTQYIPEASMALNAIGNVYFDQHNYDGALLYHLKAAETLRNFVSGKFHPEIAIYEFNAGTIYLAKANQDLNINKYVTKGAHHNFQKALEIFQDSMERDEQLGTCRMPQYADKLAQRALALFHLEKHEEAINDMKRSLEIKIAPFESPDKNITMAFYKCGRIFFSWRETLKQGSDVAKSLFKETTICFRSAENEMRSNREACLTGKDKSSFIDLYKKIAKFVQRNEAQAIKRFCERFERCVAVDSSSSSSLSSSSSSGEPSPLIQKQSDSDDGIDIDDDDSENEADIHGGIPSVQTQKEQASQFEQEIFGKIDAQVSGSESKKRQRSSSESD